MAQTTRARRGAAIISMLAVIVGVAFLNFPSSRWSCSGSPWPWPGALELPDINGSACRFATPSTAFHSGISLPLRNQRISWPLQPYSNLQ